MFDGEQTRTHVMERMPGSSFGSSPFCPTHKVDDIIREPPAPSARYKSEIVHYDAVTEYNERVVLTSMREIETSLGMFHPGYYRYINRLEQILKLRVLR